MLGAHATSRTQSVCPLRTSSSTQVWLSSLSENSIMSSIAYSWQAYLKPQILTKLSQPALAKRLTEFAVGALLPWFGPGTPGVGVISEPGRVAGAQETALQPTLCALKMSAPHVPSSAVGNQPCPYVGTNFGTHF
jgi:hypothetical protein